MTAHQWTYIVSAVSMLLIVSDLLRRGKLREKYAVAWSAIALLFLLFALFPQIPRSLSVTLGFELPSNFVLAMVNVLLLGMLLQLGLAVGKLEKQQQLLAEQYALLKHQCDSLSDSMPTGHDQSTD